jgi:hydroxymethylbilane synthase
LSHRSALRLGTRGSQLALWQANRVAEEIAGRGGPTAEIVVIKTSGDRLQDAPLSEVGGKRLFVKEIEDALLRGDIDLAVHSSKDMPAVLPEGLTIAAVLPREDPRDAVVLPVPADSNPEAPPDAGTRRSAGPVNSIDELVARLGRSPSIGTSSVRRIAQLSRLFPGGRFTPIRGNLDTRLRKLDAGDYDALVLAAAGLRRLGHEGRISLALPPQACVPAPGQGIVAVEVRAGDDATLRAVRAIDDEAAAAALVAERALVEALGGGCQTPVGALASVVGEDELELIGAVVSTDGARAVQARARGPRLAAAALGRQIAEELIAKGASEILAEVQRAPGAVQGLQP